MAENGLDILEDSIGFGSGITTRREEWFMEGSLMIIQLTFFNQEMNSSRLKERNQSKIDEENWHSQDFLKKS